jgi:hypothetical protein
VVIYVSEERFAPIFRVKHPEMEMYLEDEGDSFPPTSTTTYKISVTALKISILFKIFV